MESVSQPVLDGIIHKQITRIRPGTLQDVVQYTTHPQDKRP